MRGCLHIGDRAEKDAETGRRPDMQVFTVCVCFRAPPGPHN